MPSVRVTASVLNLRGGPGREFPVVARVPRGTTLEWLAASPDGRWLELRREAFDGELTAWAAARYLSAVNGGPPPGPSDGPPWLTVAARELGVREYPGPADNPRIVEYHRPTSLRATDDEVPWCSAFVNWCMGESGLRGTGSAAARSWLTWGRRLTTPRHGCVTVLRRSTNPAEGHVALFIQSRGAVLDLLGGNQSNQVEVKAYSASQLLGYRWPSP